MNAPKMKVLWSIDPFDDSKELQGKIANLLKSFSKEADLEIDPVYVLSPTQLGVMLEFSQAWSDVYVPSAEKALQQCLQEASLPGLRPGKVLVQARASLRATVSTLAGFAQEGAYDFVVAGTHGRRGLGRILLGSFAEQLLLQSRVPVLIVGPEAQTDSTTAPEFLIPSDFAHPDSSFFDRAFSFAAALGARATLLNVIPKPAELVAQHGVYLVSGGWISIPDFMRKEHERQREDAAQILSLAKGRRVLCDLVVDTASSSVTESILKQAQDRKASLIAMAAESGPISAAFLGSITREVVRTAKCPVWVYRAPMD